MKRPAVQPSASPLLPADDRAFRFENVTLDLGHGSLRDANGVIELRSKSFEVLCYLVVNAGRLVTKEEVLQAIWPNVTVSDESLTRCISDIRHALQDHDSRFIKTIPRRGYRFEASVSVSGKLAATGPPNVAANLPNPEGPSIAVLPFENISADPEQDYFADGVVEEITIALPRFKWLFVISRNSSFVYKRKIIDVKQVGRELGVRYVLQGSVRKVGSHIRISGQLIEATTGSHLWANTFDGGLQDAFELQDDVTRSVVGANRASSDQSRDRVRETQAASDMEQLRAILARSSTSSSINTGWIVRCDGAVSVGNCIGSRLCIGPRKIGCLFCRSKISLWSSYNRSRALIVVAAGCSCCGTRARG